eukprot:3786889-Alexandrium_andersonii.AAC.1
MLVSQRFHMYVNQATTLQYAHAFVKRQHMMRHLKNNAAVAAGVLNILQTVVFRMCLRCGDSEH